MRRVLVIVYILLLAVVSISLRAEDLRGRWTATMNKDAMQLQLMRSSSQFSHEFAMESLSGLTAAQVNSATETPVRFDLVRDAGTMHFEGSFKLRDGVGHFTFSQNPAYVASLASMGLSLDSELHGRRYKTPEETLFTLAAIGVTIDYIRALQNVGYRTDVAGYVELRIFDVTPAFVTELRTLGLRDLSRQELVALKIHGASPEFIRAIRAAGVKADAVSSLTALRIHGVTPELVAELRTLGYRDLAVQDLIAMRIHGVTPSYIRELAAAGYSNVPVRKLIALRIRGVETRELEELRKSK
jgi:hypothetical protein